MPFSGPRSACARRWSRRTAPSAALGVAAPQALRDSRRKAVHFAHCQRGRRWPDKEGWRKRTGRPGKNRGTHAFVQPRLGVPRILATQCSTLVPLNWPTKQLCRPPPSHKARARAVAQGLGQAEGAAPAQPDRGASPTRS
eukprot:scaffold97982_cov45-Phaeocystis_antarctica.AAC.2